MDSSVVPTSSGLPQNDGTELQKDLSMMERNAHRLLRLINQLLDLSRLEAGGMKLQAAPGNIVAFVKGIAHSFESSAGRRKISLTVEAEDEVIEAYFDRERMKTVLVNLLSNAFNFTQEGGSVAVTVSCHSEPFTNVQGELPEESDTQGRDSSVAPLPQNDKGKSVTITVSDTGVGISADQLDRIFDRFYQADASSTRKREGTGIGLALTKNLVGLHGGTISVQSEVGRGTTFTVRLPLGRKHLAPEEIIDSYEIAEQSAIVLDDARPATDMTVATEQKHAPVAEGAPILLFIEDNADVRSYVKQYFASSYRFEEARDGLEGIEKAFTLIPDLVISDVMMQGLDGFEVCKRLKLDERTSHIPVILLTAKAGSEGKIEGLETGADDYIVKPFDPAELLVRVKNLIEQRQKLRERFSREITIQPNDITITSIDEQFLQGAIDIVEANISDGSFHLDQFCEAMGMSRSTLNRKLWALTDLSTNEFIRTIRLKRAAQLLKQRKATVLEIAYEVGFSNPSYFTECGREQFGMAPSDYASE